MLGYCLLKFLDDCLDSGFMAVLTNNDGTSNGTRVEGDTERRLAVFVSSIPHDDR